MKLTDKQKELVRFMLYGWDLIKNPFAKDNSCFVQRKRISKSVNLKVVKSLETAGIIEMHRTGSMMHKFELTELGKTIFQ